MNKLLFNYIYCLLSEYRSFFNLVLVAGLFSFSFAICAQPGHCQARQATGRALPPCTMDSFVYQAGPVQANLIYGDEGTSSKPPLNHFRKVSRINAGIYGQRDAGITTGHGSYLPDAAGADEFVGNEWDMSGAGGATIANAADFVPEYAPADDHRTKGAANSAAGGMMTYLQMKYNPQFYMVIGDPSKAGKPPL